MEVPKSRIRKKNKKDGQIFADLSSAHQLAQTTYINYTN